MTILEQEESYGVYPKNQIFDDNMKFILHLRVHTKQLDSVEKQPASILSTNDTYNEIMQYTPELSNVPVAYEQNMSDSYPEVLYDEETKKQNKIKAVAQPHVKETSDIEVDKSNALQSNVIHSKKNIQEDAYSENTCWWCTCSFDSQVFSMPIRASQHNQFETIGCFCSPECCAAYIFDKNAYNGDAWKNYEMLHHMVSSSYDGQTIRIKLAPPREILQKYGGNYTIDGYRQLLKDYRKDVHICMPPINPIRKVIDEVSVDYTRKQHKFLPIDTSRVKKAETELSLKRKKKQSSENTLEAFMRLRVTDAN